MATAKTAEDTAAELSKEMKALRDDLTALVSTVKEFTTSQAEHAVGAAKETVGHMAESLRMTASEARHRGEVAATEVEEMIAKRPLTAVLIALGVGYLVGKLR